MARQTGYMITFDDAIFMVNNENFTALTSIPSDNKCMTKSEIEQYLKVDTSFSNFTSYLSNQLVPYEKIQPIIECGNLTTFSGNQSYPSIKKYDLGADTGDVEIQFDALGIPDRFIIKYLNNTVIDTGYRGDNRFIFGGSLRSDFTNSLTGRVDPITGNIYPFSYPSHASDGYPNVITPPNGTTSFNKNNSESEITVEVYAPQNGTGWDLTVLCPVSTTLIVTPSSHQGNGQFSSFELTVTSNTSWVVTTNGSDNGDWINPSVTSGTGTTSFNVTIDKNNTGTTNFGTVVVSGGGAGDSCSIIQPTESGFD